MNRYTDLRILDQLDKNTQFTIERAPDYLDPTEIITKLSEKLYNFKGAGTLAHAWNSKQNVIFSGPAGHGGK